jgi:glycosyltransferase involved in cell wall biosynthesis
MRYCFFASGSYRDNPSLIRALRFGRYLADRGVDVHYVADDIPHNRDGGPFDPRADVTLAGVASGIGQFANRRAAIATVAPDFVHVINPAPKTFLGLVGSRWKLVADYDEWPAGRPHRFLRKKREQFFEGWALRRAAHVIACSRYLQRQFSEAHRRQVAYIPYAVDLEDPSISVSPFAEPTAVYMGTFSKPYDLDLLFHAAKILADKGFKPRMCFVGRGPQLEMWKSFVESNRLDNMDLPGWLDEAAMWSRLRHAHALLFPIRPSIVNLARCPFKTYLYAKARRPIITNATGEVPGVLGNLGTYVECTPEGFATGIEKAMLTPSLPDVNYGVERHNWQARTDQLLSLVAR